MTDDEILLGIALILVLATGSQILASKLRVPALILLLPAGFAAGALTDVIHPDRLIGPEFSALVSMSVAVILYDAGLGLNLRKLTGHPRRKRLHACLPAEPEAESDPARSRSRGAPSTTEHRHEHTPVQGHHGGQFLAARRRCGMTSPVPGQPPSAIVMVLPMAAFAPILPRPGSGIERSSLSCSFWRSESLGG